MYHSFPSYMYIIRMAEDVPSSRPGRIRGANVPQEYELANFIKDVSNTDPSWNTNTPACEWNHVICDKGDNVSQLRWGKCALNGIIVLKYLPCSVLQILVSNNQLTGELSLSELPPQTMDANFAHNIFTGSIDFTCLPKTLLHLYLTANKLSGIADLSHLPPEFVTLAIGCNAFAGTPDLRCLPPTLYNLMLHKNQFEGWVQLDTLPSGLRGLMLDHNENLRGELKKSLMPQTLHILSVDTRNTKIIVS